MIVSFVVMVLFFFVLGVYAAQNSGTQSVVLFNLMWTGVPDWLPAVLTAAVMFVAMLLYAGYARIRQYVGRLSLHRRVEDNAAMVIRLREENDRLRGQLGLRDSRSEPLRPGMGNPAI